MSSVTLPEAARDIPRLKFRGAAAFAWGGYVDTDIQFGSFFNGDHTVSAWFMQQYPNAYGGPVLTVNGSGSYFVGQGGFRGGAARGPKLYVQVGPTALYFLGKPSELAAGKWNHIAVVRRMSAPKVFEVYLNGRRLKDDTKGGDLVVPSSTGFPNGTLRLGRQTGGNSQFYGLVDDVAVFTSALSAAKIKELAGAKALAGTEPGLSAGLTFDVGYTQPAALAHAATFGNLVKGEVSARLVMVSGSHSGADAQRLLAPVHQARMHLPFAGGQEWTVLQPFDNPDPAGSHNDYAAFCWDFVRANIGDPLSTTCGAPLYLTAAGTVTQACDKGDGCATPAEVAKTGPLLDGRNVLYVQLAPGEVAGHQHLKTGSITEALGANPVGKKLKQGQWVARAGTRGEHNCHLHFGLTNQTVTLPAALSDYELWNASAKKWVPVESGMPLPGQVFRRPEPGSCGAIHSQIKELEAEKKDLGDEYDEVGPSQKPAITQQINKINAKLSGLRRQSLATGCNPS